MKIYLVNERVEDLIYNDGTYNFDRITRAKSTRESAWDYIKNDAIFDMCTAGDFVVVKDEIDKEHFCRLIETQGDMHMYHYFEIIEMDLEE